MPRLAHACLKGGLYHVLNRGNHGTRSFTIPRMKMCPSPLILLAVDRVKLLRTKTKDACPLFPPTLTNAGAITNYHNLQDYWLQTGYILDLVPVNWMRDQYYMKPTIFSYGQNPATGAWPLTMDDDIESKLYGWNLAGQANGGGYHDNLYSPSEDSGGIPETPMLLASLSVQRPVNDPFEQMSYIARSRTLALGAQSNTTWATLQHVAEHIDLFAQYGFTSQQNDHSGIFNRSIQQLSDTTTFSAGKPFYDQLRLDLTGHNLEHP